jgi:hypothetical protein
MDEKIKKANDEIQQVLKKYGLEISFQYDFPIYRIIPDEVKLALKVLSKHSMKILFILKNKLP